MAVRIAAQARSPENERCPMCFDGFAGFADVAARSCPQCQAHYHPECAEVCVTAGCGASLSPASTLNIRPRTASARRSLASRAALLSAVIFSILPTVLIPLFLLMPPEVGFPVILAVSQFLVFPLVLLVAYHARSVNERSSGAPPPQPLPAPPAPPSPAPPPPSPQRPAQASNFYARPNIAASSGRGVEDKALRQIEQRREQRGRPGLGKTI